MIATTNPLKEAARQLAKDNHYYEDNISKTYWFPDPQGEEIRLVHVDSASLGGHDEITPAYFSATPKYGVPFASAIALIRPEEDTQTLPLPEGWPNWNQAEVWPWP